MPDINYNLKSKDDASLALQNAAEKVKQLHAAIEELQAKGGNMSALDAKNINAYTRDLANLEKGTGTASTGLKGMFNEFVTAQGGAKGLLLGIGGLVGVAGLGALASKSFETVLALDAMREESEQVSARFLAQAGSTRAAAEAMSAMNATVGSALTNDEKMAASGQIMALGLADSAQEAANLANMAVNLGDKTQSTAQRIEGLTQVLVTGRLTGLKQYGVSMQDVNARAAELMASTDGLTKIEATRQAILESLTVKLDAYNLAGGTAITKTQELKKAWEDYQDALANNVDVGRGKDVATGVLQGATTRFQIASPDAMEQLAGLESRLRELQSVRDDFTQNPIFRTFFGTGNSAQEEIANITAKIAELKGELGEESRWAAGAERLTAEAGNADQATTALGDALASLYEKADAIDVNATAMLIFKSRTDDATGSMLALNSAMSLPPVPFAMQGLDPSGVGRGQDSGAERIVAQQWVDETMEAFRARQAALLQTNTAVASDYQSKMAAAGQAAASRIGGYLSEGANASIGLNDMRTGGNQPGKNGAFEGIYRLQAWLNDGSWAENAQGLVGGDRGKAQKIVEDFQNQMFSPEVIGAIDVNALAAQAGMASLAEKSQQAFAQAIAGKAGVSTGIVESLMGMKADAKGNKPGDAAASNAMNALASSIGATVKPGSDFAGKMLGYGETIWGYTEQGMVNAAKKSGSFQAMIDAMAAAAFAKLGGGGGVGATNSSSGASGL